tara:strand:+ start:1567 stop:1782 length:216 start_codon:yes stop_codon:yes gene_type:complete
MVRRFVILKIVHFSIKPGLKILGSKFRIANPEQREMKSSVPMGLYKSFLFFYFQRLKPLARRWVVPMELLN